MDGSTNVNINSITIEAAPQFHLVTSGDSSNCAYSGLTVYSVSSSDNRARNTDGFDIGPASYVTVEDTMVTNDDDCVVLKTGASYATARNVTCVGSHGLSVGSLAENAGSNDVVTDSLFANCTMIDSSKAAGIKFWPGSADHGTGSVSNVTWRDIVSDGCDYAIQIDTCYESDASTCEAHPSTGEMTDIVFAGFSGTTSGDESVVADIACSTADSCGITIEDFDVVDPDGGEPVACANTADDLGLVCTT